MRTQAEIDDVLRGLQQRLDAKRKATGVGFHVPTGCYAQFDDWLSVVVEPDAAGMRAYQYVEALGELENEHRGDGLERVVLVPAIGD